MLDEKGRAYSDKKIKSYNWDKPRITANIQMHVGFSHVLLVWSSLQACTGVMCVVRDLAVLKFEICIYQAKVFCWLYEMSTK